MMAAMVAAALFLCCAVCLAVACLAACNQRRTKRLQSQATVWLHNVTPVGEGAPVALLNAPPSSGQPPPPRMGAGPEGRGGKSAAPVRGRATVDPSPSSSQHHWADPQLSSHKSVKAPKSVKGPRQQLQGPSGPSLCYAQI